MVYRSMVVERRLASPKARNHHPKKSAKLEKKSKNFQNFDNLGKNLLTRSGAMGYPKGAPQTQEADPRIIIKKSRDLLPKPETTVLS